MRHTLVDTSVIVEYLKGNPQAIASISKLLDGNNVLFINPAVFSEVIYVMMGYYSGRAPKTIKENPKRLPKELDMVFQVLSDYAFVEITRGTIEIAKELIEKYAMLPNDALILATCIEHGFALATLDDDFKLPAENEGVPIITG
ncbi:type II toxin-antitoxin system VapC family toxin [Thermococcus thioreducens]|uniref:Ribonuclease VapC n=1 Tax=Thermococcus thioreducens TaxID=277988 RepID=A0A0Q2S6I0_9EURY|nr:type II toxin-antitoxin system VapC family toxin [Thermococcus thioreducens]ASJ12302.1 nucleotide-binding protein [Thermococcus thioreducens]KQH83035.1 nucleotide-binding protein [Thermococcus thioreducens]SEV93234.1 Predicted nucleic acid-binding protein, contains PIN domain [Thermococcus thioreducens]